ncbi:MAG TPA: helix-turn-helix domain-containing protein [Pseudonocardia sp.]
MARRGAELREHILDTAKDLFLESGFERTSMDSIASHASTSKRSLYAHFATKDALYLAVIERMRRLFEARLAEPVHYASDPVHAMVLFCGRFLQLLNWTIVLRTWRTAIAEVEREPSIAAELYLVFFGTATERLADHVADSFGMDPAAARTLAERVLGMTLYPDLPRALSGVSSLRDDVPEESAVADDSDLDRIRGSIEAVLPAARRH